MGSAFTLDDIGEGPIVIPDAIDFGFHVKLPDGSDGLALVSRVEAAHPGIRDRLVARLNFQYRRDGEAMLNDLRTGHKAL